MGVVQVEHQLFSAEQAQDHPVGQGRGGAGLGRPQVVHAHGLAQEGVVARCHQCICGLIGVARRGNDKMIDMKVLE